jgi:hypothetical protein
MPHILLLFLCVVLAQITAACFTPDGANVVCGQINGDIMMCDAVNPRMSIHTVMSCKRSRGKFSEGTKVTGLSFLARFTPATSQANSSHGSSRGQQAHHHHHHHHQPHHHQLGLVSSSADSYDDTGTGTDSSSNKSRTASVESATSAGAGAGAGVPPAVSSLTSLSAATVPNGPGKHRPTSNPRTHASRHGHHHHQHGPVQNQKYDLLVTTNDHRIRQLNLEDRSIVCKYKGHANAHMQIRASVSECGQFVICGSDDGYVHTWKTDNYRLNCEAAATNAKPALALAPAHAPSEAAASSALSGFSLSSYISQTRNRPDGKKGASQNKDGNYSDDGYDEDNEDANTGDGEQPSDTSTSSQHSGSDKRRSRELSQNLDGASSADAATAGPTTAQRISAAAAATADWFGSLFSGSLTSASSTAKQVNAQSEYFNASNVQSQTLEGFMLGGRGMAGTTVGVGAGGSGTAASSSSGAQAMAHALTDTVADTLVQTISAVTAETQCTNVAVFIPANVLVCACKHSLEIQKLEDYPSFMEALKDVNSMKHKKGGVPCAASEDAGDKSAARAASTQEAYNFISKAILTASYDGTIRIFVRGLKEGL